MTSPSRDTRRHTVDTATSTRRRPDNRATLDTHTHTHTHTRTDGLTWTQTDTHTRQMQNHTLALDTHTRGHDGLSRRGRRIASSSVRLAMGKQTMREAHGLPQTSQVCGSSSVLQQQGPSWPSAWRQDLLCASPRKPIWHLSSTVSRHTCQALQSATRGHTDRQTDRRSRRDTWTHTDTHDRCKITHSHGSARLLQGRR